MQGQVKLGRIFGITFGLHYSAVVMILAIVVSLAGHLRSVNPNWSNAVLLSAVSLGVALFLVSILLHEVAHYLSARAHRRHLREITLFALGGVSQMDSQILDARSEFWIAISGPLASATIGVIVLTMVWLEGGQIGTEPIHLFDAGVLWLGYVNLALAALNLVPGDPLDGGRVLRVMVRSIAQKIDKAGEVAAQVGRASGLLLILFGLIWFSRQTGGLGGFWLSVLGWLLLDTAGDGDKNVAAGATAKLYRQRVSDIMDREWIVVVRD